MKKYSKNKIVILDRRYVIKPTFSNTTYVVQTTIINAITTRITFLLISK